MDRYEFNLKTQQMRKLAADGRYDEAALIADEIDWSRVKNIRLLMLTADIYEATKQPEKEFDILDIAYERSPMGKQLAYRLALVASELKEYEEAENYYKDYVDMAPNDSRRYLLRYRLSKARGEDLDLLIGFLERYLDGDMEERWSYELCELYAKAGYQDKCINLCDDLITWFGDGKYVLAALKLKKKYAPLSVSQQQKYEALKREEREEHAEETESEVGVEIARTRSEVLRNRSLSEKMQAVAEKRIQDDAGIGEKNELPAKSVGEEPKKKPAGTQKPGKAGSDAKAKEEKATSGKVTAGKAAAGKAAAEKMTAGKAAEDRTFAGKAAAEKTAERKSVAGKVTERKSDAGEPEDRERKQKKPVGQTPEEDSVRKSEFEVISAEKVDGKTRRYDGRAVRRAEAGMQKSDEKDENFESQEEEKTRETPVEKKNEDEAAEAALDFDVDEIHIKTYSDRAYDTMNIQAELAKSMEAILRTDEARGGQKATRRSGSRGSGPAVRTYTPPATEVAEDDPFGYEQERKEPEKQITGQMSIEEILKDLQTRGILKEDTVESALRVTGQLPLWKMQGSGEENPAGQMSEETAASEVPNEAEEADVKKNEAAAGVTEESVVKEMEEISLRDFVTGEIDLDIVQSEVDERRKEKDRQSAEEMETDITLVDDLAVPTEEPEEGTEPEPKAEEEEAEEPEEGAEPEPKPEEEEAEEPEEGTEPEPKAEEEETEEPEEGAEPEPKPEEEEAEEPEEGAEPEPKAEEEETEEPEEGAEPEPKPEEEEAEEPEEGAEPEPKAEEEEAEEPEEGAEPEPKAEEEETEEPEKSTETNPYGESVAAEYETREDEMPEIELENSLGEDTEIGEETDRRYDTEEFLSSLEMDLSKLGQEGNPYTQMRNEDVKRETEKMDDVFAVIREMETDLSEEDRIYNAYTEEEPKEKLYLDETDRKEFEQYLKITGMESQIAKAINDYVTAYSNDGTSKNPNILITGGAKTGKSQLAVLLIRAINRHLGRNGRKTARISGFNLNRKTLSASMPRLVGNDLLIEHAGEINRKIAAELMDILPKYTGGMIVVMEDEKARLDHLFEDYPLLLEYFPNHLDIKEYDINEWAAVAKSYARSQGYTIDELGTLALYAEIDALYGILQGLEVDDIKDIVDDAIEHSERKMGSAFSRIFGKKKETGRRVLHETDFDQ